MPQTSLDRVLVIPDCHLPFEDKHAVDLMFKVAEALTPTHIIHLGDLVDFYALSFHEKDPQRALGLDGELEAGKAFLRRCKEMKAKTNVLCGSNHHERIVRYQRQKAPELLNLLNERRLLDLDTIGFKLVPYRHSHKLGKFRFTHDVGIAGQRAALKSSQAVGHNLCIGHIHRIEYEVWGTSDGERHVGMSPGWLGNQAEIDYMHKDQIARAWSLGFGWGLYDSITEYLHLVPVPIMPNYSCVVEGHLFNLKNQTKAHSNRLNRRST